MRAFFKAASCENSNVIGDLLRGEDGVSRIRWTVMRKLEWFGILGGEFVLPFWLLMAKPLYNYKIVSELILFLFQCYDIPYITVLFSFY